MLKMNFIQLYRACRHTMRPGIYPAVFARDVSIVAQRLRVFFFDGFQRFVTHPMSTRKHKDRVRRSARRRLPLLVERQKNLCYYCKELIVCVSTVPQHRRIKITPHWITYTDAEGNEHTYRRATIEHVQRLADGGNNHWDNLVAACAKCNGHRNEQEKLPKNKRCKRCGKAAKRRHCTACFRELVREYFSRNRIVVDTAPEFGQKLNLGT